MNIYINTNEMIDVLMQDTDASWTYEETTALIGYYEDLEQDLDEPLDFDRTAIRCDWSSSTIDEAIANYSEVLTVFADYTAKLNWLQDRTQVIELDDSILYMDF